MDINMGATDTEDCWSGEGGRGLGAERLPIDCWTHLLGDRIIYTPNFRVVTHCPHMSDLHIHSVNLK